MLTILLISFAVENVRHLIPEMFDTKLYNRAQEDRLCQCENVIFLRADINLIVAKTFY